MGDDLGRLGHLAGLEQQGEFVTAEAGHRVTRRVGGFEPLGHCDEHTVAEVVAEAVVDHLEVVDVHEQHGNRCRPAVGAVEGMGDPVEEERPVGQSGQRVVEGLMVELLLQGPPVGDVAAVEHDGSDVRIVEQVGHDGLHLAPAAVSPQDPALVADRADGPPVSTLTNWARDVRRRRDGSGRPMSGPSTSLASCPRTSRPLCFGTGRRRRPEEGHRVGGILHQGTEPPLGSLEPFLDRRCVLYGNTHLKTYLLQGREKSLRAPTGRLTISSPSRSLPTSTGMTDWSEYAGPPSAVDSSNRIKVDEPAGSCPARPAAWFALLDPQNLDGAGPAAVTTVDPEELNTENTDQESERPASCTAAWTATSARESRSIARAKPIAADETIV